MKSPISTALALFLFAAFICYPLDAQAQPATHGWDDRSDEVWDEFDSGNNATTWILIGAGVGFTTAAVVYTIRKRRAAKREEEQRAEQQSDTDATARTHSFEPGHLQQIAEVERQLPVNVLLGVYPPEQQPMLGVRVRF